MFHKILHSYYNTFEEYNRRSSSECQSRTRRRICGRGKVVKINLDSNMKVKQKQGEGSRRVRANIQIYGFPIVKVKQVLQGKRFVKIKVDLKHIDKITTIKVEQIEQKEK